MYTVCLFHFRFFFLFFFFHRSAERACRHFGLQSIPPSRRRRVYAELELGGGDGFICKYIGRPRDEKYIVLHAHAVEL